MRGRRGPLAAIALVVLVGAPAPARGQVAQVRDSIARIDRRDLFYYGGRPISRDDLEAFLQQLAVSNALAFDYDESIRGIRETMREIAAETASKRAELSRRAEAPGLPAGAPPTAGAPDSAPDAFLARARPMSRERSCQLRSAFRARGTPADPGCAPSPPSSAGASPTDPPAQEIEADLIRTLLPPAGAIARRMHDGTIRPPGDPGRLLDASRDRAAATLYGRGFGALDPDEREVARALASAMNLEATTTRDGRPAFPGVTASMPVILRLAANARTDPEAYVALTRYTALLVRMDVEGLSGGGPGAPALP